MGSGVNKGMFSQSMVSIGEFVGKSSVAAGAAGRAGNSSMERTGSIKMAPTLMGNLPQIKSSAAANNRYL